MAGSGALEREQARHGGHHRRGGADLLGVGVVDASVALREYEFCVSNAKGALEGKIHRPTGRVLARIVQECNCAAERRVRDFRR